MGKGGGKKGKSESKGDGHDKSETSRKSTRIPQPYRSSDAREG